MALKKFILARKRELHHLPKAIFNNYHCHSPTKINIELSNRCNLHCRMCWFHGECGVGDQYEGHELTTREVFDLVDQLALNNRGLHIYMGGAEPYVREDFEAILRHIKNLHHSVSFTTNGTLLDSRKLKELVAIGVDNVNFSIDGYEELHDQQRGIGVFQKVTESVKRLSEYRSEQGCKKPVITVNITVTSKLMGHLRETLHSIKNATNDGADYYCVHHLWYVSADELSEHQSVIEQKLGCKAPGAVAHLIHAMCIPDPLALADEIDSVRGDPKVITFPELYDADIVNYYSGRPRISKRCIAPLLGAIIKPNGDVMFCPDGWIDDYVLGNVRCQSFQQIWNNERALRFRSVVIKEKHFQGCNRCSWMYSSF